MSGCHDPLLARYEFDQRERQEKINCELHARLVALNHRLDNLEQLFSLHMNQHVKSNSSKPDVEKFHCASFDNMDDAIKWMKTHENKTPA